MGWRWCWWPVWWWRYCGLLPPPCCFGTAYSLCFLCSLCQQRSSLSTTALWRCWWWRTGEGLRKWSAFLPSLLCVFFSALFCLLLSALLHCFYPFASLLLLPMGGGAWPFLVGGAICLVNSVNERDLSLLTSYAEVTLRGQLLRGTMAFQAKEVWGNNRSMMPLDVLGRTRATLMYSMSL